MPVRTLVLGNKVKLLSVVGARPQFVKLGPVNAAIVARGHEHVIVHTGQHYDYEMSDFFFDEFGMPNPSSNIGVGSGSHGAQTGLMLQRLEVELIAQFPDWVIVYGDTNSTVAAALASAKLHLPVAHVEAGLRSFNRAMPEEINRIVTDHCSDLLLCPTREAMGHAEREGLGGRSLLVGDVMTDVFRKTASALLQGTRAAPSTWPTVSGEFLLATIHRDHNTDDPKRLGEIIAAMAGLPVPVVLPVHPRLRAKAEAARVSLARGALLPTPPLNYRDMVWALIHCRGVVTDSGGLQKEAFLAERVCTTLRPETEWGDTLQDGWNVLISDLAELGSAAMRPAPTQPPSAAFGDGRSANHIVSAIEGWLGHPPGAVSRT